MSTTETTVQQELHCFYTDHQSWLIGWLRCRVGCAQQAADIAQDTFVRVLSARESLDFTNAKAMLTVIARGLVIDHFRRGALERAYLEALQRLPEACASSPETHLLVLETLIEVDKLLDGLPRKARRAFLLAQLDGLTYAQIATELGVSVSSIQQYMIRAYRACYAARYQVMVPV